MPTKVDDLRIYLDSIERMLAFYRRELEVIPEWHEMHLRYREQHDALQRTLDEALGGA